MTQKDRKNRLVSEQNNDIFSNLKHQIVPFLHKEYDSASKNGARGVSDGLLWPQGQQHFVRENTVLWGEGGDFGLNKLLRDYLD